MQDGFVMVDLTALAASVPPPDQAGETLEEWQQRLRDKADRELASGQTFGEGLRWLCQRPLP